MRLRRPSILLLSFIISLASATIRDGPDDETFLVVRAIPQNTDQLELIQRLHHKMDDYDLDFWLSPRVLHDKADIMIRESHFDWLKNQFEFFDLPFNVTIPDVQKLIIDREHKPQKSAIANRFSKRLHDEQGNRAKYGFGDYHSYEKITEWMNEIARLYPDKASVMTIGTTEEGRPIRTIKIGKDIQETTKPVFWIDGGIHAREWAAVHTALYFIDRLIADYDSDKTVHKAIDNLHFYITPVLNPDGYEYSRSGVSPMIRLWRKNRAKIVCKKDNWFRERCCGGVDLNRNFDWFFGEIGSSSDRCSEIYQGESAFSEAESKAVRDMLFSPALSGKVQGFITLHTYSQMWIHPFSHMRKSYSNDISEIERVGRAGVAALQNVYGTKYRFGTGADILYPSSGGSDDWAKGKGGAKFVYLLELRPAEEVWDGFILDSRQLIPTGKETWAGIRVVIDAVLDLGPIDFETTSPVVTTTDSMLSSSLTTSDELPPTTVALEQSTDFVSTSTVRTISAEANTDQSTTTTSLPVFLENTSPTIPTTHPLLSIDDISNTTSDFSEQRQTITAAPTTPNANHIPTTTGIPHPTLAPVFENFMVNHDLIAIPAEKVSEDIFLEVLNTSIPSTPSFLNSMDETTMTIIPEPVPVLIETTTMETEKESVIKSSNDFVPARPNNDVSRLIATKPNFTTVVQSGDHAKGSLTENSEQHEKSQEVSSTEISFVQESTPMRSKSGGNSNIQNPKSMTSIPSSLSTSSKFRTEENSTGISANTARLDQASEIITNGDSVVNIRTNLEEHPVSSVEQAESTTIENETTTTVFKGTIQRDGKRALTGFRPDLATDGHPSSFRSDDSKESSEVVTLKPVPDTTPAEPLPDNDMFESALFFLAARHKQVRIDPRVAKLIPVRPVESTTTTTSEPIELTTHEISPAPPRTDISEEESRITSDSIQITNQLTTTEVPPLITRTLPTPPSEIVKKGPFLVGFRFIPDHSPPSASPPNSFQPPGRQPPVDSQFGDDSKTNLGKANFVDVTVGTHLNTLPAIVSRQPNTIPSSSESPSTLSFTNPSTFDNSFTSTPTSSSTSPPFVRGFRIRPPVFAPFSIDPNLAPTLRVIPSQRPATTTTSTTRSFVTTPRTTRRFFTTRRFITTTPTTTTSTTTTTTTTTTTPAPTTTTTTTEQPISRFQPRQRPTLRNGDSSRNFLLERLRQQQARMQRLQQSRVQHQMAQRLQRPELTRVNGDTSSTTTQEEQHTQTQQRQLSSLQRFQLLQQQQQQQQQHQQQQQQQQQHQQQGQFQQNHQSQFQQQQQRQSFTTPLQTQQFRNPFQPTFAAPQCVDQSPWCSAWISSSPNICSISSIYMRRDCARSCRYC